MTDPTNPDGPVYPSAPPTPPLPPAGAVPPPVGQWGAPVDPTAFAPIPPAADPMPELQPVSSGKGGRKFVAVGAALLVLGGGVFATTQLFADQRGAGSPEEAGEQLLEAISQADVLGVIDLLPEGERQLLVDVTDELSSEGDRLGVLGESFQLDGFPGVTIEINDPELEVEELSDGLALVTLVGGEASFELEGDELTGSLGEVVEELAGANDTDVEAEDVSAEVDIAEMLDELEADADEFGGPVVNPFAVAVVEEDGRWFPSLGFTIAEFARADANSSEQEIDAPDLDDGIEAEGADSPEAAIQALLDAAAGADAEEAIAVLDPGELGALQVYADVFLGELSPGEDTGVTVELTDAEVTALGNGVNRVVPTGLTVEGEVEGGSFDFELADGCITAVTESDDAEVDDLDLEACAGDDLAETLPDELGESFEGLEPPAELTELLEAFEPIEAGIITVERDGEHFVAPIRTLFDVTGAFYRGLEREDLEEGGIVFEALTGELDDEFEAFFDDLTERFEEQFEAQLDEEFEDIDDSILDDEVVDDEDIDDPVLDEDSDAAVPRVPTGTTGTGPNGELLPFDVIQGTVPLDGPATFTVIGVAGEAFIGAQSLDGHDLTVRVTDAATGAELGFNDDFIGLDPEVFVTLEQGQPVTVTVEEFFGEPSEFVVYYETP